MKSCSAARSRVAPWKTGMAFTLPGGTANAVPANAEKNTSETTARLIFPPLPREDNHPRRCSLGESLCPGRRLALQSVLPQAILNLPFRDSTPVFPSDRRALEHGHGLGSAGYVGPQVPLGDVGVQLVGNTFPTYRPDMLNPSAKASGSCAAAAAVRSFPSDSSYYRFAFSGWQERRLCAGYRRA